MGMLALDVPSQVPFVLLASQQVTSSEATPPSGSGNSPASGNPSRSELNELLRQSPFGRLSEVLGDDLYTIFSGISGSGNPFGGSIPGNLPYGGNPFAGNNLFTLFGGGNAPPGSNNPFGGGQLSEGEIPFPFDVILKEAGVDPEEALAQLSSGGNNPFASGGNPFSGGGNPFGGGNNPFSNSDNPFNFGGQASEAPFPFNLINGEVQASEAPFPFNFIIQGAQEALAKSSRDGLPNGQDNQTLGNGNWYFNRDNKTIGNGNWYFGTGNETFGNGNWNFGSDNTVIGNGNWVFGDDNTVIGNGNWYISRSNTSNGGWVVGNGTVTVNSDGGIPGQGQAVPEPSSVLGVIVSGAFGLGTWLKRKRRQLTVGMKPCQKSC